MFDTEYNELKQKALESLRELQNSTVLEMLTHKEYLSVSSLRAIIGDGNE